MNKLVELLMRNRGIDVQYLNEINSCPHVLPHNIDEMCARLKVHHDAKNRIGIITDFDMDGLMSGVIGFAGLSELGFNATLYVPNSDSYGVRQEDIDKILAETNHGISAIITADVGITAEWPSKYARSQDVEFFITDHHQPDEFQGPAPCDVYVDPCCDHDDRVYQDICGAHVLYLVLHRYAELYCNAEKVSQIERLRVFAGIGTVSDSMPMLYENRQLVKDAIDICRLIYNGGDPQVANMILGETHYRLAFVGLFNMIKAFADINKVNSDKDINEEFFGFYVAPAFNSIKRLRRDVRKAWSVFFGGAEGAAAAMTEILEWNEERRELVDTTFAKMWNEHKDGIHPLGQYIFLTDSAGGIRGLLAQRIMSELGSSQPVMVLSRSVKEDGGVTYEGSGRCPKWFPMKSLNPPEGVRAAGHNVAFGLTVFSEEAMDKFIPWLEDMVPKNRPDESTLLKESRADFVISTYDDNCDTGIDIDLFLDFLDEIETFRPWGPEFSKPRVELRFVYDPTRTYAIGTDKNHARCRFDDGFVMLCWRSYEQIEALEPGTAYSIQGTLSLNEYNGNIMPQFIGEVGSLRELI